MRATGPGARAIQAGIWSLALVGCEGGPPTRTEIGSEECYALDYDDDDRADATLFPRVLSLAPGSDSGAVSSGSEADASAFWSLFGAGAGWRRLPNDSVALSFSNGVSATDLVVAHDGNSLRGTATFRFQTGAEAYPLLEVRGRRTDCDRPS